MPLTIKSRMSTGDIRRFRVQHCGRITPAVLLQRCVGAHGGVLDASCRWKLYWEDVDGDMITLVTQDDVDQAVADTKGSVLKVFLKSVPVVAPASAPVPDSLDCDGGYIFVSPIPQHPLDTEVSPRAKLVKAICSFDRSTMTPVRTVESRVPVTFPATRRAMAKSIKSFDRATLKSVRPASEVKERRDALLYSIRAYSQGRAAAPPAPPTRFFVDLARQPATRAAGSRHDLLESIRHGAMLKRTPPPSEADPTLAARKRAVMKQIAAFPGRHSDGAPALLHAISAFDKSGLKAVDTPHRGPNLRPAQQRALSKQIVRFDRASLSKTCKPAMHPLFAEIVGFPGRDSLNKVVPRVLHPDQVRSKLVKHRVCRPASPFLCFVKDFPALRYYLRRAAPTRA
mmetsp:Transcript_4241/g.10771  ORF Transcript_4241/g.10771 Transcript_4241/m.10771 type:complete len:398 (+) Transcript_4241:286-1479(+)|eukprot:CAMPEP_0182916280 /NCGR_PEP_ID=MMETSP0105_2-20130417/835_1 /TAXON_ID=81532 ORGANISM="Acanthoeca-like sp., Strain 10tr" /NCGR_SAMPLE_ID=MMETSP0105_2 /ASSEMBLY_ACC=CAM_ASM_000205 /LENGTH=397 /DNA_ID=CAMNT_0025053213 /DNA_START=247 /DNA_END=1440 /DNA_ORIENTATION=+